MGFKVSLSLFCRSVECTLSCQVKDGFLIRAVFLPKLMLLCSDAKIFWRYINSVLSGLFKRTRMLLHLKNKKKCIIRCEMSEWQAVSKLSLVDGLLL